MILNVKAWTTFLSLSLASQAILANDQTIVYQNKLGSKLELNLNQETLTGTFTTVIASKECENVVNVKRPIIGYINGTAITFSVNYPTCGSIVTFTGHINTDRNLIDAIALIAHQTPSKKTNNLGAEFISQAKFTREKKTA